MTRRVAVSFESIKNANVDVSVELNTQHWVMNRGQRCEHIRWGVIDRNVPVGCCAVSPGRNPGHTEATDFLSWGSALILRGALCSMFKKGQLSVDV